MAHTVGTVNRLIPVEIERKYLNIGFLKVGKLAVK